MFKIESYVTPILLSYVDKYVRDFKPADAQVSLWGGGVALHNLVLKADVLQQEMALPFTLVSGRIHELLIQVPWTKIMSEPIVVTIDTIECILSLDPPPVSSDVPTSPKTQVVEAPPGYMQALVRRIVSNIALRVHHLIVKYVQDDVVMSLNVKHLSIDSADANWEPAFADIEPSDPLIRRLVRLDDLTLCLDKADSDGKIRFYQEPLLYRCQLDFRVLTRLVSANTRRASSLSVQMRSTKLAFGITSDQMTLLLRLMRERPPFFTVPSPPAPNPNQQASPLHGSSAEIVRTESWSEWAWSWLPSWKDRQNVEEERLPAQPTPMFFSAYFDQVTVLFKVMESDASGRKRARGVLELTASYTAFKTAMCTPATLRVRFGTRSITLSSTGKCVCGHLDINAVNDQPTVYLQRIKKGDSGDPWKWPEDGIVDEKIKFAHVLAEEQSSSSEHSPLHQPQQDNPEQPEKPVRPKRKEIFDDMDHLWDKMSPLIFFEHFHERSLPKSPINIYDNPPRDFQYSNWVEECDTKVHIAPLEFRFCKGLEHRLAVLFSIYQELPPIELPGQPAHILTVEECEALYENMPISRIKVFAADTRLRLIPWDHSLEDKPAQPPLVLDLEVPDTTITMKGPLYPDRVCSAASQIPVEDGMLWEAGHFHVCADFMNLQAKICSLSNEKSKPFASADLRIVLHILLHQEYYNDNERVTIDYTIVMNEAHLFGSAARLQAAYHVAASYFRERMSVPLRYSTLPTDALNDDDAATIDFFYDNLTNYGYINENAVSNIVTVHSVRATTLLKPKGGTTQQAWLFAGPDSPKPTPYIRVAVQWCKRRTDTSLEYLGIWMETAAVCIDPLFMKWLAYKPQLKSSGESQNLPPTSKSSSSQYFSKRRATPSTSSGRGLSRSGSMSAAELVHTRTRSAGSSSEPSEKKERKQSTRPKKPDDEWTDERYSKVHERVRKTVFNLEVGFTSIYIITTTASALDSVSLRDAMERHARASQSVFVFEFDQFRIQTSTATHKLWCIIRDDGPTALQGVPGEELDTFPWNFVLVNGTCYTLEAQPISEQTDKEKSSGLRSPLKATCEALPRSIMEMVTTTATLSVVTKTLQVKCVRREDEDQAPPSLEEERLRYFLAGANFRPATIKEFLRGPNRRLASNSTERIDVGNNIPQLEITGPVTSLGINMHIDTPPILMKLEHDQIHIVAGALHCLKHVITLLGRPSITLPKHGYASGESSRSQIRSVSEMEGEQTPSEASPSEAEIVEIYNAEPEPPAGEPLRKFIWIQWSMSHVGLVVTMPQAKLTFQLDDVMTTLDIQSDYQQVKLKLTSIAVKHYERNGSDDWTPGALGGRVLEVREPSNVKEEVIFLIVTVTQATLRGLLRRRGRQCTEKVTTMWEVNAMIAPLEAVLQPNTIASLLSLLLEMPPRSSCPLDEDTTPSAFTRLLPFCYVTAGGLRLLLTEEREPRADDDTFILAIGKTVINPHPANPIFRRIVNPKTDSSSVPTTSGHDGRQYETIVSGVTIRSAQLEQLASHDTSQSEILKRAATNNPALKWTQPILLPVVTPILHTVDISSVMAPPYYCDGVLVNAPAIEVNLLSDCTIDVNIEQLELLCRIMKHFKGPLQSSHGELSDEENECVCPYATTVMKTATEDVPCEPRDTTLTQEMSPGENEESGKIGRETEKGNYTADSGAETGTSSSKHKLHQNLDETNVKKSSETLNPSDYLEVFLTMGKITLSLYTTDDNSFEVKSLRPPHSERQELLISPMAQASLAELKKQLKELKQQRTTPAASRSLTENARDTDIGKTKLDIRHMLAHTTKRAYSVSLVQVKLHQPNMYYWKRKDLKTLQLSVFDAWVGLGDAQKEGRWHKALLSSARGVPDPITGIYPALATMKLFIPVTTGSVSSIQKPEGSIRLDVERPVLIEVSSDKIRRLKGIYTLLQSRLPNTERNEDHTVNEAPLYHKLRELLEREQMESVTLKTNQIGVSGSEGTIRWEGSSLQIAQGNRPERLIIRGSVTSLLVAAGPPRNQRQVLLQPLMLGVELDATWDAWRRLEGDPAARNPSVQVTVELDRVSIDIRPSELMALSRIQQIIKNIPGNHSIPSRRLGVHNDPNQPGCSKSTSPTTDEEARAPSANMSDSSDQYYKDDLRSGAFKVVTRGELPAAYQVLLSGSTVSWRYPHPRAITKIVVFPLHGQDTEIDCVLEAYSPTLSRWELHTNFKIPVGVSRELELDVAPPEAVFAVTWRICMCGASDDKPLPYALDLQKFIPRFSPLVPNPRPKHKAPVCLLGVTAQQLLSVIQVDSYFAPRLMPHCNLAVRLSSFEIHAHNSLLDVSRPCLEGYYLSKPLTRSHRVFSVKARDTTVHAQFGSPAGVMLLLDSKFSGDILDTATGSMEQLVDEFHTQGTLSLSGPMNNQINTRMLISNIRVALNVSRIRTLHALAVDWVAAMNQYNTLSPYASVVPQDEETEASQDLVRKTDVVALEGRVSLWIHNSCATALRVSQEGTEDIVVVGPGVRLAYRWRFPSLEKTIRMAVNESSNDWRWSSGVPFTAGASRVRLEGMVPIGTSKNTPGATVHLYVKVEDTGARREMHISGRLNLANMLRLDLGFMVRARCTETSEWKTVCSGGLGSETFGTSVLCGADTDLSLKIKLTTVDNRWSGDIPLKECPKQNVPWLVKVPSDGELPYLAVWCRVVRASSDGRILATIWPLYVLRSHLPLDADVVITTEPGTAGSGFANRRNALRPLMQLAPGRGASTHLLTPGTTSARHNLSFQYRNIECPVTREAVPLHYGVTNNSVFDQRKVVTHINEVITIIKAWLERSSVRATSKWPYSLVTKHWYESWEPAIFQPRCDVTARYRAVIAGGGCCLEVQLSPIVLLCNAVPFALTLRAHDAAPLCKVGSGKAISPPSSILKKPFFMSVENFRDTFVSGELAVSEEDPGRYGAPPAGRLALGHAANFAIQCNQKVALLTMYYEIVEEINVLGVTSTFELINRLNTNILVSAIAVPIEEEQESYLNPTKYKVVPPTKEGTMYGTPLSRFFLRNRWRGSDPAELRTFLCLTMSSEPTPSQPPVPVQVGHPLVRRALALFNSNMESIPVVVVQMRQDNRWQIVIAPDPCPQFLVHNKTCMPISIGQPVHHSQEQSTSTVTVIQECQNIKWRFVVRPNALVHYSTPAHCERYPPPQTAVSQPTIPFLTFARVNDEGEPDWCPPVAVADGEHLLQLGASVTVKLLVCTHSHSTHLELQPVDEDDISASDIRKRLSLFSAEHASSKDTNEEFEKMHNQIIESLDSFDQLGQKPPEDDRDASSKRVIQGNKSDASELKEEKDIDVSDEAEVKAYVLVGSPNASQNHTKINKANAIACAPSRQLRCVTGSIVIEMGSLIDSVPLLAVHMDRIAVFLRDDSKKTKVTVSVAGVQVDNLQYETGQYDFAVVATTRAEPLANDLWPPLWNMSADQAIFSRRKETARLLLKLQYDKWTFAANNYRELSEVDICVGPLALYLEDAYVQALVDLYRQAVPSAPVTDEALALAEERSLVYPLRLRVLHIHPLDLTLTLHTAVRMYIALDQSPLRLSAFKLEDMMTSTERLSHALTVHYLSGAILGAGWVVGGLELLGAPGALAARVGGATGGVRGVASATAAALLRSLSAWAGSLARNLDLLAGDEEHARRAAAARRRAPPSLAAGLATGITNFAINILGAVGGLAHHPLVGVAVGETESGTTALRRGLLGALTKPLSATADLVAYAGHGLLTQTGWDPVPQPRKAWLGVAARRSAGWQRDCVRWAFRLSDYTTINGFEVMVDNAPMLLVVTQKFIVVTEPETERIVETIELQSCGLGPNQGQIIELFVPLTRQEQANLPGSSNDDNHQERAAAMARVARYTGADGGPRPGSRVVTLLPVPGFSHSLYATLATALNNNAETHFALL